MGGLAKGSGVGPPRCLRIQIPCRKTYWSLGSRLARDTPERVFAAGVYSPVTPGVGGIARKGPGKADGVEPARGITRKAGRGYAPETGPSGYQCGGGRSPGLPPPAGAAHDAPGIPPPDEPKGVE